MLPFTREQFLAVFVDYNRAVWPAPAVAYAVGLAMVVALSHRRRTSDQVIGIGLATLWVWTGIAYHALFFSTVNRAAFGFAALFVAQGLLLAHAALVRRDLQFVHRNGSRGRVGWALLVYASVLYPLIAFAAGHVYPELPMFGITPCPTTLFTFGLLLMARPTAPQRLLWVPVLWALIGGSAAFLLAIPQDWPLLLTGLLHVPALWRGGSTRRTGSDPARQ